VEDMDPRDALARACRPGCARRSALALHRRAAALEGYVGGTNAAVQRRDTTHSGHASRLRRPNFRTPRRAESVWESACRSIPARNLCCVPGVPLDQATPTARERVVHMHAEASCPCLQSPSTSSSSLSVSAAAHRCSLPSSHAVSRLPACLPACCRLF
jgi:hypothetical protein